MQATRDAAKEFLAGYYLYDIHRARCPVRLFEPETRRVGHRMRTSESDA